MRKREFLEAAVFVVCLALEGYSSQAQDTRKPHGWQYATLTLRSSMEVGWGSQEPFKGKRVIRKAIGLWLESPAPGKTVSHYFISELGGEKLDGSFPSFYRYVDAFYEKATGTKLPEKDRNTTSVLPILNVLGESDWELVSNAGYLVRPQKG